MKISLARGWKYESKKGATNLICLEYQYFLLILLGLNKEKFFL